MALKKVEICGVNTSKLPVLSEEEKEEQAKLRQEYIASVRASLVGQLENTYIVDEKGNKKKVKKK